MRESYLIVEYKIQFSKMLTKRVKLLGGMQLYNTERPTTES